VAKEEVASVPASRRVFDTVAGNHRGGGWSLSQV